MKLELFKKSVHAFWQNTEVHLEKKITWLKKTNLT